MAHTITRAVGLSRPSARPTGPSPVAAPRLRWDRPASGGCSSIPVPGLTRGIGVKIASCREEFEQAFGLLAAKYRERGYEAPSSKRFRFTPFHALPGTVTFVAKEADRVLATLTLVPDNALLGLPMECIYGEEVAALRREGRRLGEVISLADDGLSTREFIRVFSALNRLTVQYHTYHGGDTWVIAVNPRHSGYYNKVLGFRPFGPRRSYPAVQDYPAEAFLLDVDLLKTGAPGKYQEWFGEALPAAALTATARPCDYAHYFGAHSTQLDDGMIREILETVEDAGSSPRAALQAR
jgi:hypothetical protein